MCELTEQLKFCTCSEAMLTFIKDGWIWELKRGLTEWYPLLLGKCRIIHWSESDQNNRSLIVDTLNSGHAFDFEYLAKNDDELTVMYLEQGKVLKKYEFKCWHNAQWGAVNDQQYEITNRVWISDVGTIKVTH